jgi:nitrate reductase gamma subunit
VLLLLLLLLLLLGRQPVGPMPAAVVVPVMSSRRLLSPTGRGMGLLSDILLLLLLLLLLLRGVHWMLLHADSLVAVAALAVGPGEVEQVPALPAGLFSCLPDLLPAPPLLLLVRL